MRNVISLAAIALLSACWGPTAEGRFACSGGCPTDWVCRRDGFCWQTPEGPDGGRGDTNLPDPCSTTEIEYPDLLAFSAVLGGGEVVPIAQWETPRHRAPGAGDLRELALAIGETSVLTAHIVTDDRRVAYERSDDRSGAVDALDISSLDQFVSVALAEEREGSDLAVRGFGFRGPVGDGEVNGEVFVSRFIVVPTMSIFAGTPARPTSAGVAVVAGYSSIFGRARTPYYIAREFLEDLAVPVLGAVDSTTVGEYRSSVTPDFPLRTVTDAVGDLVLIQDPESFALGFWEIRASADGVQGDDFTPMPTTVPVAGLAGITETGDPSGYLVALPRAAGPSIRIASISCTTTPGSCVFDEETAHPLVSIDNTPEAVRIDATGSGYLLTVLRQPSGHREVTVLGLSTTLESAADAILFEERDDESLLAIRSRMVERTDGSRVFVVATLVGAGTDHFVRLLGMRSCPPI